jgi:hypothetical protein
VQLRFISASYVKNIPLQGFGGFYFSAKNYPACVFPHIVEFWVCFPFHAALSAMFLLSFAPAACAVFFLAPEAHFSLQPTNTHIFILYATHIISMCNEQTHLPFKTPPKREPHASGKHAPQRRGRLMHGNPMRPMEERHRAAEGVQSVSVSKGIRFFKEKQKSIPKSAHPFWNVNFRCSGGGKNFRVYAFCYLDGDAFIVGSLSLRGGDGAPAEEGEFPGEETAGSIRNYLFKIARDNGAFMAFALPSNPAERKVLDNMGFAELQREEVPQTIADHEGCIMEAPTSKISAEKEESAQMPLFWDQNTQG